jgi:ferredoxin
MPSERDQEPAKLHDPAPATGEASGTASIVIRLEGRKHSLGYQPGDTILETVRRAGLKAPFSCERGNCGTCMAFLVEGEVAMRVNNVLDADEVAEGWVLTCQGIPTSREVVVDYDR